MGKIGLLFFFTFYTDSSALSTASSAVLLLNESMFLMIQRLIHKESR